MGKRKDGRCVWCGGMLNGTLACPHPGAPESGGRRFHQWRRRSRPPVVAVERPGPGLHVATLERIRAKGGAAMAAATEVMRAPLPNVAEGPLRIVYDARLVTLDGEMVRLSPTEFRVLFAIARRRGRVATPDDLEAEAWRSGYFSRESCGDRRRPTTTHLDNAIRSNVGRVRRKLGAHAGLVETVQAVGYRLRTRGRTS